jgi:ABC-2 type transport system ATP-binding protein
VGIDVLEVRLTNVSDINRASAALRTLSGDVKVDLSHGANRNAASRRRGHVPKAVRALDLAHIEIADLTVRHPTLDEVFLKLTGQPTEAAQ